MELKSKGRRAVNLEGLEEIAKEKKITSSLTGKEKVLLAGS